MKIVGYTDKLSVSPGERLQVMVSAESARVSARLVRLIHGDPHPDGPGYRDEPVVSSLGEYDARHQRLDPGSYAVIPHADALRVGGALTVHVVACPTLLGERDRALISKSATEGGWSLILDPEGRVRAHFGADGQAHSMTARRGLRPGAWYSIVLRVDPQQRTARLDIVPLTLDRTVRPRGERVDTSSGVSIQSNTADVLIGAQPNHGPDGGVCHTFDGKIGDPAIFARALSDDEISALHGGAVPTTFPNLVAAWDFAQDIPLRRVVDAGPFGAHGRTVNMPTRGVPGPWWQRDTVNYQDAPREYAAIHFHEDDLDDAGWTPTIEWVVPPELPSGVYGVVVADDQGNDDCMPVFVRPRPGRATSKVLFLAPVFSYLAYANEHSLEDEQVKTALESVLGDMAFPLQPEDRFVVENQLHSLYDRHHDGSGVCYSSWLRPILSMRPRYRWAPLGLGSGGAHQFGADLHIVDWLHAKEISFDVATDVDVHRDGVDLLSQYQVVISGTHPEYPTRPVLDALRHFTDSGGRLMYLGGNGYYWVTGFDPEDEHTIEVRRWGASTRAWEMEPGAWYLSTSGELGGLWRMRGLAPQSLLGVGFTAQGYGKGRPYRRLPASNDPRVGFIFAGVDGVDDIGDFPNLVTAHGAAGFEMDRADSVLGTPQHALVVATADGFSELFQHAVEEVLVSNSMQGGSVEDRVRSDMVFFECPGGGAVFSVGAISWSGSLSYNDYDNDVSSITENVLRRFMDERPFELDGAPADEWVAL